MVALTLLLAGGARWSGIGRTELPDAAIVDTRALWFADRPDGGIVVREAPGGALVAIVAPGTNGFLRGVLRGLARERRRDGIGDAVPFQLTRWSDGRLSLEDSTTGRTIALEVFGPTNSAAFIHLLDRNGPLQAALPDSD
jgi:putative photosynthetic complex assembly protein